MKHYYSSRFLDSNTMISEYYDLPMDPDPWTKTAGQTHQVKDLFTTFIQPHPQKRWGWNNRFLLQVVYKLRPAAAGVAKLAARDSQLRVQMLLF